MSKKLLAVYGTLKKGFPNNYLLFSSKLLGSFQTEPIFNMHSMGFFPALTLNGKTSIELEIYDVDKEDLFYIYSLEGYSGERDHYSNWYDTILIDTPYGEAEMFYMKGELSSPIIESGNW